MDLIFEFDFLEQLKGGIKSIKTIISPSCAMIGIVDTSPIDWEEENVIEIGIRERLMKEGFNGA